MSTPGEVTVMTWNVQHANIFRTQRQVAWLNRVAADVLVLTEVPAGVTGDRLAHWLEQDGYTVLLPDPGQDRYRVLLAARGMLEPIRDVVSVMPHRFAAARVKHSGGPDLVVAGMYVPSRGPAGHRNVAKRAFQEAVAAGLPALREHAGTAGPCLVVGDLNVVEPGHVPHYRVFGGWEYEFYRAFAAAGFLDAYRLRHPGEVEHSWFGRAAPDGSRNGYRFDHGFITAEHQALLYSCRYQHRPRLNELSDHSALILTLRT